MTTTLSPRTADESLPPPRTGLRRSLVILAAFVVIGVWLFVARTPDDGWEKVSTVQGLRARGVVYLEDRRIFLVQTADGPLALSAEAAHLPGDLVVYCTRSDTFQERHGGKFDRLGHYMDGPPTRGLDRVAVRVRGDVIELFSEEVTPGAGREVVGEFRGGEFCGPPGPDDPAGFTSQLYRG